MKYQNKVYQMYKYTIKRIITFEKINEMFGDSWMVNWYLKIPFIDRLSDEWLFNNIILQSVSSMSTNVECEPAAEDDISWDVTLSPPPIWEAFPLEHYNHHVTSSLLQTKLWFIPSVFLVKKKRDIHFTVSEHPFESLKTPWCFVYTDLCPICECASLG